MKPRERPMMIVGRRPSGTSPPAGSDMHSRGSPALRLGTALIVALCTAAAEGSEPKRPWTGSTWCEPPKAPGSSLATPSWEAASSWGKTSEIVSFAQPIKEMLQTVFKNEYPYNTFIDDSRKNDKIEIYPTVFMTVRELLQKVGTECFRNIIHPNFWVGRGMAMISKCSSDFVLIPDVRFENELHAINNIGYTRRLIIFWNT